MQAEQLTEFERVTFLETLDTCRDAVKCLDYAASQGVAPSNANSIRCQAERNINSLQQILGMRPAGTHVGQGSLTHCSTRTGKPEFVRA